MSLELNSLVPMRAFSGTLKTQSYFFQPKVIDECASIIELARQKGLTICPRGRGYSYADVILNHEHIILDLSALNRILEWNPSNGQLRVEPGVSFAQVLLHTLPDHWTLMATPGGMGVTIGGAVSNNVHGKDSWQFGNFGDHVLAFKLLKASGQIESVTRESNRPLFQAALGGMGLLGIICEVTLQLRKVPSPFVEVELTPVRNIEESTAVLESIRNKAEYAIAWVDSFPSGKNLGRGFVTASRFIESTAKLRDGQLSQSLSTRSRIFGILPAKATWRMARPFFGPMGLRPLNQLMYWKTRVRGASKTEFLYTDYTFMHNKIPGLNTVYDPHGFLEFEPLIPRSLGPEAIREMLSYCQQHGSQSLLCGMKMHRDDEFMLSYAGDGYSLGIDIQIRGRQPAKVRAFADGLYELTIKMGGKIYCAKDELLRREHFAAMYPRLSEWKAVKNAVDPEKIFVSDAYRRLIG